MLHFGLRAPFWAAAGLETVNIVLTALFLPATKPLGQKAGWGDIFAELRKRAMLNLMARQWLYIFSFTYFFTVFGLYLNRQLHLAASDSSLLLAFAGGVGAATLIFGVAPLERRLGAAGLAQVAFASALVAYVLIGFVHSLWLFLIALVLWAAGGAALRPTLNKMIADAAPQSQRGAILGFADSLNNAAMIFAPAIGAAILGHDSGLSGALPALCVAIALLLGFQSHEPR